MFITPHTCICLEGRCHDIYVTSLLITWSFNKHGTTQPSSSSSRPEGGQCSHHGGENRRKSGPKIDSQHGSRLQVLLGRKHGKKCFWQRPRDPVEKVLDTPQKRHTNSSGQGIRWQIPQRICGTLKEGSIKRETRRSTSITSGQSGVTCQHARRQFDAVSTRRILPRWQRVDVGDGTRGSPRA